MRPAPWFQPWLVRTLATLALALALAAGTADAARELHVAVNGADGALGDAGHPWASIQKALSAAEAGDTVVVHAGTYTLTAPLTIAVQATEAAPLVVRADGAVTIRDPGGKVPFWSGAFTVSGAKWVTLRGFRIENSYFFGVLVTDASDHVTVESCQTDVSGGSGIAAFGATNVRILDNDIRRACESTKTTEPCQECLSVAVTDGFEVARNVVRDSLVGATGGEGIDIKDGSSNGSVHHNRVHGIVRVGIYVDAWEHLTQNIDVYANEVHDSFGGLSIASEAGGEVRNVRVHDNLIYRNGSRFAPQSSHWTYQAGTGLFVAGYLANGPRNGVHIFNNTVVGSDSGQGWGTGIEVDTTNITDLVIRDNIVADNRSQQIRVASGVTATLLTNLTHGNGAAGTDPLSQDPRFVDAAGGDFRPLPGSPAIDAGTGGADVAAVDYAGNPRLVGEHVDLGAYELDPAHPPSTGGGGGGSCASGGGGGSWALALAAAWLLLARRGRAAQARPSAASSAFRHASIPE